MGSPVPVAQIYGGIDWTQVTQPLTAGTYTLKWEYSKNAAGAPGEDNAWLDNIKVVDL